MKTCVAGMLFVIGTGTMGFGCSASQPDDEREAVGELRIALTQVPADVACLRITVAGTSRTTVHSFDVTAGQSTVVLVVDGAPIGPDTVSGQTFPTPCSAVTLDSVPNWIADPVGTNVEAGASARVLLIMRRNGEISACVDFQDEDAGGVVAHCATFKEFDVKTGASGPLGITVGPDKNLWFTEAKADRIGRITPSGVVDEFPLSTVGSFPEDITLGPDGALWFAELHAIGRLDPATGITKDFPLPTTFVHFPAGITTGPDGNLYYTADNGGGGPGVIGSMSPTGIVLAEFSLPTGVFGRQIITGPDNDLWFASLGAGGGPGGLVRFTIATSKFDVHPSEQPRGTHAALTAGLSQDLWFTIGASDVDFTPNFIGHMSTAGGLEEFPVPSTLTPGSINAPTAITLGPDGNFWFAIPTASPVDTIRSGKIGRITPGGDVALFPTPDPNAGPQGIVAGPDGNVWFTEFGAGKIAYIVP